MLLFQKLGEKILGGGKSMASRFFHFLILVLVVISLDYYTDFPFGYIQQNQLEQINEIDVLLNSKNIDSTNKSKLRMAQIQVYNKYQFLLDLRLSLSQVLNSKAPQKSAIQSINTTINNTKIGIPYFFCSNFGKSFFLFFWWIIIL
jgi:hypothetical protein